MSRRTLSAALAALAIPVFASPASANFDVAAKIVCFDVDGTKLVKEKFKNDAVIADCLGVASTDPAVAAHALTWDSDTRELHVIRRCDEQEVCDLSDEVTCEDVSQKTMSGFKNAAGCIYRLLDFGPVDVEGTMICSDKESYSYSSNKYTYKIACSGSFSADGDACAIAFKSGRLFEESGTCPLAD